MKTVAALGFNNCQVLDLTGPLQVFSSANSALGYQAYQLQVLGLDTDPIVTNSGIKILPDAVYSDIQHVDTLLLSGGRGVFPLLDNQPLIQWVQDASYQVNRIASVCSGAFLLAEAGLLQGKKAVTHWKACKRLAKDYEAIEVEADAIWLQEGNLYTSAGVTSGIDLALALVEEDFGHAIAMDVARELVVFVKRPGGQAQFSWQLEAQNKASGAVAKAQAYIQKNLKENLGLESLAEHCCVSERHLFRLFKESCDCSPAVYIENMRLNLAQELVSESDLSIEQVAQRSGFSSADNLRRVFLRRLGVNPSEYRDRFGKQYQDRSAAPTSLESGPLTLESTAMESTAMERIVMKGIGKESI
ncbi:MULTISPECIES: GlxA family transcriptional regulator [unclassified Neptuniibacter]|uniref:GlxA family transcriptional regulator n=1 Tax=unclassified Neptuniibacter TaxID=2630693 RepID=UPI000C509DDB|nr:MULTISPECIES: GlxA family transcriptional regulator [unclassified Neptuniibacter]MAY41180.1 AraC family transcriptional regulator [Oceanospirillaceae bacterium]|tara:strand:+ start:21399 stop:22475 length:1077 start_codon:yes stop_codon:yes gene_type:complete